VASAKFPFSHSFIQLLPRVHRGLFLSNLGWLP
jgi:hypothetical protein